jgi:AraC family transcriptional regulator
MSVEIVTFPETKVAVIEHCGPPALEYETAKKLIAWRMENKVPPTDAHRSYGLHYHNPNEVEPANYRVDFCVSVERDVIENSYGVTSKTIPELRCARLRHIGSRENVIAAQTLYQQWLPTSGESLANYPAIFHYVNVGPNVVEADMITDVYLPLV